MDNHTNKPLAIDDAGVYRIEVQGILDRTWQDCLGGMQIQVEYGHHGAAVTTLAGPVIDQAALSGILNLVYDLGMPLLSVAYIGPSCRK